MGKMKI